jgi:hypothetical protein
MKTSPLIALALLLAPLAGEVARWNGDNPDTSK